VINDALRSVTRAYGMLHPLYAGVLRAGSVRGVAVPYAALPQLWRLPYSVPLEWPFEGHSKLPEMSTARGGWL
jgi:hypothetical protein